MRTVMRKALYILKCVRNMNYRSFFNTLKELHKESGRNYVFLIFDIVFCGFRYGAGFNDYQLCQFYRLPLSVRKTYITRGVNNMLSTRLSNPSYTACFNDKRLFYRLFQEFLHREWFSIRQTPEEWLLRFLERHESVIIKPAYGCGGAGVQKIERKNFSSPKEMLMHIRTLNTDIVEECIVQHETMSQMNYKSVNTIRVVTVIQNENVNIIYAYLRIGVGTSVVDNLHAGGIFAPIDIHSGLVTHDGYDKNQSIHKCHPESRRVIKDFQIPSWEQIRELTETAAKLIPQMQYIGWDIAVDQHGNAILVEGNHLPGYDFLQMPVHMSNEKGMLPSFEQFLPGKSKNDSLAHFNGKCNFSDYKIAKL